MFSFIKDKLSKIYTQFTEKVHSLFGRATIDEATLKELEVLLLSADAGVKTTRTILQNLTDAFKRGALATGQDLKQALHEQLLQLLQKKPANTQADVYVLVGINGSGKTTFAGKLAHRLKNEGKKTLLVAADTFRAAAPEQLEQWANKADAQLVMGKQNQDPASVVFAGCEKFKNENFDALIIDTAGRLQTKTNLMRELEKIKRIVVKQLPEKRICTLLTVDAMLGQNSLVQAQLFHESTQLSGIVLTKMDGTGKGGIVFSIVQELRIPIAFISFGEQLENLKLFDAQEYVTQLLNSE